MNRDEIKEEFLRLNPQYTIKDIGFRLDGRLELFCPHGIGHTVYAPPYSDFIHGCDGCCKGIKVIKMTKKTKRKALEKVVRKENKKSKFNLSKYIEEEGIKISNNDTLTKKMFVHKFKGKEQQIMLMGDEHIGSKFYAKKEHHAHLEHCLKNNIPLIHMGDMIEYSTKTSVGAGVFEQSEFAQEQFEIAVATYKPLAKKGLILGLHPGNHPNRAYDHAGIRIAKIMAQILNVPYLGIGAVHYIHVGKQRYTLYTTHGAGGSTKTHTKIANTIQLANMIHTDIFAKGHDHEKSSVTKDYYVPNLKNQRVELKQKTFINTGSYLSHWGSYAHNASYEPSKIGSPILILSGKKRSIFVSL